MVHGTPRVLGVGAKVRGTVLASNKAWGLAGDLDVDNAVRVDGGLDVVGVTFFVQGEGQVISAEGVHLLIEHAVGERIGVPDMGLIALEVEDLRVEMRGGVDTPIDPQEPQRISSVIWHMGP